MQREFTVSTWMKIFYYLLATVIFCFSVFLFSKPNNLGVSQLGCLFPLFMMLAAVLIAVNTIRRKIVVTDGIITYVNLFSTQQLATVNVKGWRQGRKIIIIEPNSPTAGKIIIRNYMDLNSNGELINYLNGNFTDLDATNLEEDRDKILQDSSLGFTVEERQTKLDNAKKVALGYNIIGVIVGVAALVMKQPVFIIIAIIYPLLSVPIIITSNGLIKLISNIKRSVYPFTIIGFAAPAMALLVKSMNLYYLLSYDNIWLPALGFAALVIILLIITGINRSMLSVGSQVVIMFIVGGFYAFASIIQINCAFDGSQDKVYYAGVLGHHISHGKSTRYYLYLSTWGPCHEQKQISVGSTMYHNTNVGDTVKIDLKPGLLSIPWFVVVRN